ncbi:hypothetical protein RND71_040517 [Anisodus tanguticus]|uniref:ATP synthase subunit 9, mitochondrial n=1 Tax=Anisodus tanguticus TaxID=243964 RepID=A0AAE1UVT0_9SOLA|nr:hypothetical protein RND71_040517 [Anisodus tanguticus]
MLEGAKSIGVGAATIASAGAAIGIGNVLSSSIHSVARNPSLAKQLFGYAILGFALTEAIASAFLFTAETLEGVLALRRTKPSRGEEEPGDRSEIERALDQLELDRIQEQKDRLAEQISPRLSRRRHA